MNRFQAIVTVVVLVVAPGAEPLQAAEVWTGPRISFSKAAGADPTLESNQDRITSNVWITRSDNMGLFNAKSETGYVFDYSPADTEWSYGTTADLGSLTFLNWRGAVGSNPPTSLGQDMVLHLISDDIYLDIKFLSWGVEPPSGGYFSYERSTPIPEPATAGLVLLGLSLICPILSRRLR